VTNQTIAIGDDSVLNGRLIIDLLVENMEQT
jgi:hypothetical protein